MRLGKVLWVSALIFSIHNILLKMGENYPANRASFLFLIFQGRSRETLLTGQGKIIVQMKMKGL